MRRQLAYSAGVAFVTVIVTLIFINLPPHTCTSHGGVGRITDNFVVCADGAIIR